MIYFSLHKLKMVLYKIEPFFKYIPFIILIGCFIEVFTYEYDPLSGYKRTMMFVYQTNGYGLLSLAPMLYLFSVKKTCIHPIITTIGLAILCVLNIIILSILNFKIWYYDISGEGVRKIMESGDRIGTIYDSIVILFTLIIASFYFAKEEIFCKKKYNEKSN